MALELRLSMRSASTLGCRSTLTRSLPRPTTLACSSQVSGLTASSGSRASPESLPEGIFARGFEKVREVGRSLADARTELESRSPSGLDLKPGHRGALVAMAAIVVPPVAFAGGAPADILTNRVFMAGFVAWFLAQFGKIFTHRYKHGVWDIRKFYSPGGMPSSHSSLCTGVTTAIAMQHGFSSALFATALCFSLVVMYDAMGVRRHAGKQAEVLNQVVVELMDEGHPLGSIKLKEVLGHTPRQVVGEDPLDLVYALILPASTQLLTSHMWD
eukprot:gene18308-24769_t